VGLLRGINVGGHRKVPMATLRTAYGNAGCSSVVTYIQSGNVVFDHPETDAAALAALLEDAVSQACGVDARLVLRTSAEWKGMVGSNPFPDLDPDFLNVTFLARRPDPERVMDVEGRDVGPDRVRVMGRHVYAWLPEGVRAARLPAPVLERMLGVGTARNWRTVMKLTDLVADLAGNPQPSGEPSNS
jgi:uncharacterized protein (DUF1697 family)